MMITFPALMNLTMLNKWNIREGNYTVPRCVSFMFPPFTDSVQPKKKIKLNETPSNAAVRTFIYDTNEIYSSFCFLS